MADLPLNYIEKTLLDSQSAVQRELVRRTRHLMKPSFVSCIVSLQRPRALSLRRQATMSCLSILVGAIMFWLGMVPFTSIVVLRRYLRR